MPVNAGQAASAAPSPSPDEVSVLAHHSATARSYSAIIANAQAASDRRCASVNPPAVSAAITSGYASGEVTTATLGKFFAAARAMAGPPMSICSTHSSTDAPDATVSLNG